MGVELDEPHGSNNGTEDGIAYFECAHNCGIFVRDQMVRPRRCCWLSLVATLSWLMAARSPQIALFMVRSAWANGSASTIM